jgi:hypothetical protein
MLLFVAGLRADVRPGDSLETVVTQLGKPAGRVDSGNTTLLQYERGQVKLRDGRVVEVSLVSAEAARAAATERAVQIERALAAQRERTTQRRAEGEAELARLRADPSLALASGGEQLRVWQSFRLRYPEVASDSDYRAAWARDERERQAELAQAEQAARLAELEARVADAERRAARAERWARDDDTPFSYWPTVGHRPHHHRSHHDPICPPTLVVRPSPPPRIPELPSGPIRQPSLWEEIEARQRAVRPGA